MTAAGSKSARYGKRYRCKPLLDVPTVLSWAQACLNQQPLRVQLSLCCHVRGVVFVAMSEAGMSYIRERCWRHHAMWRCRASCQERPCLRLPRLACVAGGSSMAALVCLCQHRPGRSSRYALCVIISLMMRCRRWHNTAVSTPLSVAGMRGTPRCDCKSRRCATYDAVLSRCRPRRFGT